MPGDFNTGRDCAISIIGINGIAIDFKILTEFDSQQHVTQLKSSAITGETFHENIPDEWTGTLIFDRASPEMDIMIAAYEQAYFDGKPYQKGQISQRISEDKGITTWVYRPVVFHLGDAGRWRKDAIAQQRVQWRAARRIQT